MLRIKCGHFSDRGKPRMIHMDANLNEKDPVNILEEMISDFLAVIST